MKELGSRCVLWGFMIRTWPFSPTGRRNGLSAMNIQGCLRFLDVFGKGIWWYVFRCLLPFEGIRKYLTWG